MERMIYISKFIYGNIQRKARSDNMDGPLRPPQEDQKNINITRKKIRGHIHQDIKDIEISRVCFYIHYYPGLRYI